MKFPKLFSNPLIALLAISLSLFVGVKTLGKGFQNTESSVKSIIFSDKFKLSLTEQERSWLKQHPVIKLGIDRAFPPFGSINEKHEYVGFSADIMRVIEHRLGLNFDIKIDDPWNKTMEMAKAGEIDMISALVNSKQRQKFLIFSDSYIKNPTIIINDAEVNGYIGSLKNLNGKKVAIESGSYSAGVLSQEYPLIELIPVQNTSKALSLVEIGRADAYVGNGVTASYLIRSLGYHNLSYSGQTEYSSSHSIGFINKNALLAGIVQKALASISKQDIEIIANYWFGLNNQSLIHKDTAVKVGLAVTVLLILLGLWVKNLHDTKKSLKISQDEMKEQSEVDSLTGIGNRRKFYSYLDEIINRSEERNSCFTLFFLDLDLFKEVNDVLGHAIGDLLLVEASKRLTSCINHDLGCVARIGGDEFMVILPDMTDKATIEETIKCIQVALNSVFNIKGNIINITTSIGVTRYPHDTKDAGQLVINSDQAMYASKKKGRNCHSYFDKKMYEETKYKCKLTSDLRQAVSRDQFTLHFQPIVDLKNNSITKAEALIRWNHPERGLVSPLEFIPLAEEAGIINEIGDWVFRSAIDHTAKIQERSEQIFQMTINTSPVQYTKNGMNVPSWFEYLSKRGLNGENIIVEITEGVLMEARESVVKRLFQLRDLKVGVAIDDFGTGYSSLSYLKKFDIDFLKIDQSFVKNLKVGSDDVVLIQAIIVMAHQLGIKVVAEGIETKTQMDILIENGCDYGQGYYFSRPLSGSKFLDFYENWDEKLIHAEALQSRKK